jgi:hypothetical protein
MVSECFPPSLLDAFRLHHLYLPNAYAEPVVGLDLDIVVAADNIETLIKTVKAQFKIQRLGQSVKLSTDKSDLRIQLQMDSRYQDFITRSPFRNLVLSRPPGSRKSNQGGSDRS